MILGKKIIVAVCGSIAAYKSVILVRSLIKDGAEVKVIMTSEATHFVGALTFSTLSRHDVYSDISSEEGWNNHVELGLWADLIVVAPATANTLAKMAQGLCDNILLAVYLSARCPIWIAPAMDVDMWHHPATQRNVASLGEDGVHLIPVGDGELASGLVGEGRMAEPHEIMEEITGFFKKKSELTGTQFLVTAGPTYEDLDPVRYIGNRSSGKMGIAIAKELADRGARVDLVIGPTHQQIDAHPSLNVHHVRSAREMAEAAIKLWPDCAGAVFAAAVADYRPAKISTDKIKKKEGDLVIELERTVDIAKALAKQKTSSQLTIGFALETQDLEQNAQSKLARKNFDMIVLNSPNDAGAGFQHDTNKVTFYWAEGKTRALPLLAKTEVASEIVDEVIKIRNVKVHIDS